MAACTKDGYRYVIVQDRKRVPGLLAYDSYKEAESVLLRFYPRVRDERSPYIIRRELAR